MGEGGLDFGFGVSCLENAESGKIRFRHGNEPRVETRSFVWAFTFLNSGANWISSISMGPFWDLQPCAAVF